MGKSLLNQKIKVIEVDKLKFLPLEKFIIKEMKERSKSEKRLLCYPYSFT